MCIADAPAQKFRGLKDSVGVLEGPDQCFHGGLSSDGTAHVTTHAIRHRQQHACFRRHDADSILVLATVPLAGYLGGFDIHNRDLRMGWLPADKAFSLPFCFTATVFQPKGVFMICSMTGFARGDARSHFGTLTWELRTVNHRYLDVSLRLPEDMHRLEPGCRERIAGVLRRGKLDGQLRFEAAAGNRAALEVDEQRARAVAAAADRVGGFLPLAAPINSLELLRWPGVVIEPQTDVRQVGAEALRLLDEVLVTLTTMRTREGERIASLLRDRARQIGAIVRDVRTHIGGIREQLHTKCRRVLKS